MSSQAPWRPGAPAERTSMAWVRTGLSVLVASGAAVRIALEDDLIWAAALGEAAGMAGLASIVLWWRRARRSQTPAGMSETAAVAAPRAIATAVVSTCLLGAAALALALDRLL